MLKELSVQDYNLVLTPYQELFYLEWLQDPTRSDYNIIMDSTVTVTESVDPNRFCSGLEQLARENFIYSHNVANIGGQLKWVPNKMTSKVAHYYQNNLDHNELYRIISKPFDLENDILLKVLLIRVEEHRYRILFIFPHIAIDGVSTNEMYVEWANYYNDKTYSRALTMEDQYKKQEELYHLYNKLLEDNKAEIQQFWSERLSKASGIDLDFLKRSTVAPAREFRYVSEQKFSIDAEVLTEVKKLRTYKLTPYLYGQLVLAVLMHKVSGNPSIGINYPIALMEGKDLPYGAHVNTMIIDYEFNTDTSLNDIIDRISSYFRDQKTSKAKYLPISEIVKFASDKSVLDIGFAQTFLRDHPIYLEGMTLEKVNHEFHIDLVNKLLFEQEQFDNQLNYRIRYDDHLLDSQLVGEFIAMYIKLFDEILSDLNEGRADKKITEYELLSKEHYQKLVLDRNHTEAYYPKEKTLSSLFEDQVEKNPNKEAFVFYDKVYTYSELNIQANQLAHHLIKDYDIHPEDKIALVLERNEYMIFSILGVLKSGAAYIPLDPEIPEERLKYILENTGAKLIITNSSLRAKFDDSNCPILEIDKLDVVNMPATNPTINIQPNHLAYIIFTSGTTGNPKGVMINHSSAVNLAVNQGKQFGLGENSEVKKSIWYANYTFDAHISEVFTTLGNGHTLHFITGTDRTDLLCLDAYINKHNIDLATIPPVLLDKNTILNLKTLIVAGDTTHAEVMHLYNKKGVQVINAYGPTEATVCATLNHYKEGDLNTNIGYPIGNVKTYILDANLKPLPIGMIGELYLGGAGIARGYCNNEALTNESFIQNPFQSEEEIKNNENNRIYKTGDLVRLLPDGSLDFIGRNDQQVIIKGYRIELGEIENRLLEVPTISNVAVIVRTNASNNKYIAAYYIADQELDRFVLEKHLVQYLPEYMLPVTYTRMDGFPTTVNGKLDVKRLPAPNFTNVDKYVAPSTELEIQVCELFAATLGLDRSKIGVEDDFLHMGGDSISSIQLINRLRESFDIRMSVKDIFQYTTVKKLSSFITSELSKDKKVFLTEQGILKDSLNFLPIQKWFFDNIDSELFVDYNHWNQSFMLDVPKLNQELLEKSIHLLQEYHDAFHLAYSKPDHVNGTYLQYYQYPLQPVKLNYLDVSTISADRLQETLNEWQKGFDIFNGPLFHIAYLEGYENGRARIHFALHHLIVDAVSWRIIKNDLQRIYSYLEEHSIAVKTTVDSKQILGEKGSSYRQWSSEILSYNNIEENERWSKIVEQTITYNQSLNQLKGTAWTENKVTVNRTLSSHLTGPIHQVYNTQVNDLLLTALSKSLQQLTGLDQNFVTIEGHGREELFQDIDINNTMGWFTSMYPIELQSKREIKDTLTGIKDAYRKIPYNGISYGATIGYNNAELPQIGFNYLGQFDSPTQIDTKTWEFSEEFVGKTMSPLNKDKNLISINCALINGSLQIYLGGYVSDEELVHFGKEFELNLKTLVEALLDTKRTYLTVSDIDFVTDDLVLSNIQKSEEVEGIYLANSLQQGFVIHALSQGDVDEAYRTQLVWEYSSHMDEVILKQAWGEAQKKYATLRLRFSWDEKILQIIDKKGSVDWRFFDVGHLNESEQNVFVEDLLNSDRSESYDLAQSGLFRLYLVKKGESNFTCIFNNHHAIMDGWSNPLLLMFVHDTYLNLLHGKQTTLDIDTAYADAQIYLQESNAEGLSFWDQYINQFEIAEDLSVLLKASKRHIKLAEYKHIQSPEICEVVIPENLLVKLKELCKANNTTLNTLFQYSWHKQLALYGSADVTVTGMTVSGRNLPIKGIEESVGLYINTLPVVLQHKEGQIIDAIKELQGYINDINSHSEVNLAKVQKGGERLFNSLFVFENYPLPKDFNSGQDLSVQFKGITEKQDYPLVLTAYEENTKATLKLQYASELFDETYINQIVEGMVLLLTQFANHPTITTQEIEYLNPSEYTEIVNVFNERRVDPIPYTTIHLLVEKQVELHSTNIAVDYEDKLLSYKVLNEKANRLAAFLKDIYHIQPDDFVGLLIDRSEELPVTILAVLKAGGAYVPMDPTAPEDRLKFMVEDSAPKIILTSIAFKERLEKLVPESVLVAIDDPNFQEELEKNYSKENLNLKIEPNNLAYLIYTSGTTGTPKGVMIEHQNVINLFVSSGDMFSFDEHDSWTLFHSYTFDFSVWELWGAFFYGAKLVIPSYEQTRDMNLFYRLCADKKVSVLSQTPNAFYQFADVAVEDKGHLTNLKYIVFGGEALNLDQLQPWYNKYADHAPYLINMYGITETTVHVTYKALNKNDLERGSLIGKPLPNYTVYLLNNSMRPLPIGAIGEMYVGGEGVARGYLNNEELTIERFIANPFQTDAEKQKGINSRLYKSGDLARFLPTGELEYIGRNDFQVKIRGFRIELGEIESRLSAFENVKQSTVLVKEHASGGKYLVGYYVSDEEIEADLISNFMKTHLPDYMIPSAFVSLQQFPLTVNGKLDRNALPEPTFSGNINKIAARNELERQICTIYAEVLGVNDISIDDDFFKLGGDSISSIQLISRLRQKLGLQIRVKDIFTFRTVKDLYNNVISNTENTVVRLPAEQGSLSGGVPLLPIQEWFFDHVEKGIYPNYNYWNQAFLVQTPVLDLNILKISLTKLVNYHDTFKLRYKKEEGKFVQYYYPEKLSIEFDTVDASKLSDKELSTVLTNWQNNFDILKGKLFHVGYISGHADGGASIHFAFHHLIIDVVSWRIIKNDLQVIYDYLIKHEDKAAENIDVSEILGEKSNSYRQWVNAVHQYHSKSEHIGEIEYWNTVAEGVVAFNSQLKTKDVGIKSATEFSLNEELSEQLLREVHHVFGTDLNDILLSALAASLKPLTNLDKNYVLLEGHGRESVFPELDVSGTIGWFTSMYPLQLAASNTNLDTTIIGVKDEVKQLPNNGIGYGAIVGYTKQELPSITFNYLGQFDGSSQNENQWDFVEGNVGQPVAQENKETSLLTIAGALIEGKLHIFVSGTIAENELSKFSDDYKNKLEEIAIHLLNKKRSYLTPSDIDYIISEDWLNSIQAEQEVEAIYKANSLQQGFIYHALHLGDIDSSYRTQLLWDYNCSIDEGKLLEAWKYAQQKFPTLRLRFGWEEDLIQIIDKQGTIQWKVVDITSIDEAEQEAYIQNLVLEDRNLGYDLSSTSLFRLYLIKKSATSYTCLLNNHHAILDGWSNPILLSYVHETYVKLTGNKSISISEDSSYLKAQEYLQNNQASNRDFWNNYLEQIENADELSSMLKSSKKQVNVSEHKFISNTQQETLIFDKAHTAKIKDYCSSLGITINALLQYLWHKPLSIYQSSDTTVVGMTVAGRNIPIEGIEQSTGLYINTLPLIAKHKSQSIAEALLDIQQNINSINERSNIDLAKLQKQGVRLFNTLFIFENYPTSEEQYGDSDLVFKFREVIEKQDYPLTVTAFEQNEEVVFKLQYAGELFDQEMIMCLLDRVLHIANQIVTRPAIGVEDLTYLSEEEHNRIIHEWNSTRISYPIEKTFDRLFEEQVALTPNAIALIHQENELTYSELSDKSSLLALYLQHNCGIKTGDMVALYQNRSENIIISVLAIMKAGAVYVPMDIEAPVDRIEYILSNTDAKVIITDEHNISKLQNNSIKQIRIDHSSFWDEVKVTDAEKELIDVNKQATNLIYTLFTSGTTGQPKGVMIEHHSFVNILFNYKKHFEGSISTLSTTNYVFDIWGLEYGLPLITGGTIELADSSFKNLDASKYDFLQMTPSLWSVKIEEIRFNNPDLIILVGGEPLTELLLNDLLKHQLKYVLNVYGPTETTIWSTDRINTSNDHSLSVGRPVANTSVYILDPYLKPIPVGVIGELYIGGHGVGRGYLKNDELNAEKFIANPFQSTADEVERYNDRIYQTGDLVRYNANGEIEYIGRNDFQVKIRGHRIELGEIETCLLTLSDIKQVKIIVKEHPFNQNVKNLIAYYVSNTEIDSEELKAHLANHLPDYMIPTAYIHMTAFPVNANGKLNLKALPESTLNIAETYVAPETEVERHICQFYATILSLPIEKISVEDDFFGLGGDSILSIRLVGLISRELNKNIQVSDVFTYRTVRKLAQHLAQDLNNYVAIKPRVVTEPAQQLLSFAQERLWFIDSFEGGTASYNMPMTFKLSSDTNVEAIAKSIQKVIDRHEVLRSTIKESDEGVGYQEVHNEPLPIHTSSVNSLVELDENFKKDIEHVFDLRSEYPIRVCIYNLNNEYYMSIVVHHIAFDGWSVDVFLFEINQLYEYFNQKETKKTLALKPLPIQYKDFALWQRSYLAGEILDRELKYWKNKLSNFETLNLKTDKVRPAKIDYLGRDIDFTLNLDVSKGLRKLAQHNNSTLYNVLLSGFYLLLKSYSNQNGIIIGTPIANRNQVETTDLIGFFVNTLVLRQEIDSSSNLIDFIKQVSEESSEAQRYQNLPFEKLLMELEIEEDLSRHPIFQVMFGLQQFGSKQEKESLLFEPYRSESSTAKIAKFDITLMMDDSEEAIKGSFNYATSLFNPETIENYVETYQYILQVIVEQATSNVAIGDLDIVSPKQHQLLNTWNQSEKDYPSDLTACQLFEQQVVKTPNNIAFVYKDAQYTYESLNEKLNQMAHFLVEEHKVKVEDRVALLLDRNEYMLFSMFGTMKAGAAYVPIDTEAPVDRIAFLLEDTGANIILTNQVYKDKLEGFGVKVVVVDDLDLSVYSTSNYESGLTPNNLAYIIYTSGTTGRPKGVMVEHRNLVNSSATLGESFGLVPCVTPQRYMWYANYVFDAHLGEIGPGLFYGHSLYLIGKELRTDLHLLKLYIEENQIDIALIPSALLDKECMLPLKTLIVAGDVTRSELLELYTERGTMVVNAYGPTECTVCTTAHRYKLGDFNTNIGKVLANYKCYVLNEHMKQVPIGAIGELYVGGVGVSRGYQNNVKLTQESFISNPFQTEEEKQNNRNERIYKTGDLVRFLPGGDIHYLGRNDHQVKIRGFRIELGEIENTLMGYPAITQSAAVVQSTDSSKYIAAYYVSPTSLDAEDLENYLSQILPSYMLPQSYTWLTELPQTVNGKLDVRSLPKPMLVSKHDYVPPRTALEKTLCQIFAEILNLDKSSIGIEDDFFRLGGNSILAMKLVHRINSVLNSHIKVVKIFSYKTISQLIALLSEEQEVDKITVIEVKKAEEQVLSFAQERLWFINQLDKTSLAYNIPIVSKLNDAINTEILIEAIRMVVHRHEVLRSLIKSTSNSTAYQEVIDDSKKTLEVGITNVSSVNDLNESIHKDLQYVFNLDKEYPIKVQVYTFEDQVYMSIIIHHIAFDGWSVDVFLKETRNFYQQLELRKQNKHEEASRLELPILPIQYKDYALWQRQYLTGEVKDQELNFWKEQLSGVETLKLPLDYPRPFKPDHKGDDISFVLDEQVSSELRVLSKTLGVSLYSILLSSSYLLMSAYSHQKDIVLGTPIANRHVSGVENLIGFFVNTLAIRQKIDDNQLVKDFIVSVAKHIEQVQQHQDLPFDLLVNELDLVKDQSMNPIFQVLFTLESFNKENLVDIFEPYLDHENQVSVAKFDMTIIMNDSGECISGVINYAKSLFRQETILNFVHTYQLIVKQLTELNDSVSSSKSISDLQYTEQKNVAIEHTNDDDIWSNYEIN